MNWYKIAQHKNISESVKHKIRTNPFFIALFRKFDIPLDKMDSDLDIQVKPLDGSFCEANDEQILIDDKLANSQNFLTDEFHFVAHEILHWLRRQREQMHYFADPEEVEGFNVGIAYMLSQQRGPGVEHRIVSKFLPLIKINIPDDNQAREFLKQRLIDARKLLSEMGH